MRRFIDRSVLLASASAIVGATAALAGSGVGGVFNLGQVNTVDGQTKLMGTTGDQQLLVVNSVKNKNAAAIYANAPNGAAAVVATSSATGVSARALGASGLNYGVYSTTGSPAGYAGYFQGAADLFGAGSGVLGLAGGATTASFSSGYQAGGKFAGPYGLIGVATYGSGDGVQGYGGSAGSGYGVYGRSDYGGIGLYGSSAGYAIYADGNARIVGNLSVTGSVSKASGSFRIDHPLDPENKYLSHSFVESPDMMNVYNGIVITDARGEAVVQLPAYFDALNRDPRYQLTVIGSLLVACILKEEADNAFTIKTAEPGVKVSWQVTGIRKDPYAVQHPIVVEEDKAIADRGHYLQPEAYGQPASLGIGWKEQRSVPRQAAAEAPAVVKLAAQAP